MNPETNRTSLLRSTSLASISDSTHDSDYVCVGLVYAPCIWRQSDRVGMRRDRRVGSDLDICSYASSSTPAAGSTSARRQQGARSRRRASRSCGRSGARCGRGTRAAPSCTLGSLARERGGRGSPRSTAPGTPGRRRGRTHRGALLGREGELRGAHTHRRDAYRAEEVRVLHVLLVVALKHSGDDGLYEVHQRVDLVRLALVRLHQLEAKCGPTRPSRPPRVGGRTARPGNSRACRHPRSSGRGAPPVRRRTGWTCSCAPRAPR